MPELRFRVTQSRIVIPVVVLPPSESGRFEMVPGRGLLDTGASTSGIAKRIARQLNLTGRGKRPIVGVRGLEQVERYVFRLGVLLEGNSPSPTGAPYVLDGDVFGIEFAETENFDVLIGMDIIRKGDMSLSRTGDFHFAID